MQSKHTLDQSAETDKMAEHYYFRLDISSTFERRGRVVDDLTLMACSVDLPKQCIGMAVVSRLKIT